MALASLYPKNWSIIVAGLPISGGFDESKMIQIEKSVERFKTKVGMDGRMARVRQYDESHTVTIYLMNTSIENAQLSALYELSGQDNGQDVGTFLCKDRKGPTTYYGAECFVYKPPTFVLGNEAQSQEWVIMVPEMVFSNAGVLT